MPSDKVRAYTLLAGGSLVDTSNTGLLLTIVIPPWAHSEQGKPKTYGAEMWYTQLPCLDGGGYSSASEGVHQAVRLL
jgi:hypothetical protein